MDKQTAIQEAAFAGINNIDHLIRLLSHQNHDCREFTDLTVSKFNNLISVLNRMGHARFRRAPSNPPVDFADQSQSHSHSQLKPFQPPKEASSELSASQTTLSFLSAVTGDDIVSNGKVFVSSSGKPPLPSSYRKKCRDHVLSSAGRCHCSKTRKSRFKKIVRVPAINSKITEIPPDEYSWRKYGQKPIIGSPYTRGYYRCSSVRGCPARKHVERARDNPRTLIIAYEGEHRHSHLKKTQLNLKREM